MIARDYRKIMTRINICRIVMIIPNNIMIKILLTAKHQQEVISIMNHRFYWRMRIKPKEKVI
jgi:hypothetical protein